MRLFVSINLPESFNSYLRNLQAELERSGTDLQHAGRKSGFHLTLFFLGEVPEGKIPELVDELKKVQFKPFKLSFWDRLGSFQGRSVFVDLNKKGEGYEQLVNLQKKVLNMIERFGFRDERKFSPHITLSRVKSGIIDFSKIKVETQEFDVEAFYLMQSRLGAGGSEYEIIEEFKSF